MHEVAAPRSRASELCRTRSNPIHCFPSGLPMKTFLAIVAVLVIAGSLFADYKWRQWMAARRRDHTRAAPSSAVLRSLSSKSARSHSLRPAQLASCYRLYYPITISHREPSNRHASFRRSCPFVRPPSVTSRPRPAAAAALAVRRPPPAPSSTLPPPGTQVHDPSALKPPAGAHVAIVEWEDMECPDCARANPLLREAADKYNIPWVRHDFPLRLPRLELPGRRQRPLVRHQEQEARRRLPRRSLRQPAITIGEDPARSPTSRRSSPRTTASPFPSPSIPRASSPRKSKPTTHSASAWASSTPPPSGWSPPTPRARPFVEVVDRTKLYQLIDQALADTKSTAAPSPRHTASK